MQDEELPTAEPRAVSHSRKRVVTAARREQNRLAQQKWRQRQKETQPSHRNAAPALDRVSGIRTLRPRTTDLSDGTGPSHEPCGGYEQEDVVAPAQSMQSGVACCDVLPSGDVRDTQCSFPARLDSTEEPEPEPILQFLVPPLPRRSTLVKSFPTYHNAATVDRYNSVAILAAAATTDANSLFTVPVLQLHHSPYASPGSDSLQAVMRRLPDPSTSNLMFCDTVHAILYNAVSLGFNPTEIMRDSCLSLISPFYRPTATAQDDPKELMAAAVKHIDTMVPASLRPTLPQILVCHHPYLDLLPFPAFRARTIVYAASTSQLHVDDDLKWDIFILGGITYSGQRESNGGQPHDRRSWTIASWFRRKWKLLVDGDEAEDADAEELTARCQRWRYSTGDERQG